jgi:hypothetical protein
MAKSKQNEFIDCARATSRFRLSSRRKDRAQDNKVNHAKLGDTIGQRFRARGRAAKAAVDSAHDRDKCRCDSEYEQPKHGGGGGGGNDDANMRAASGPMSFVYTHASRPPQE